MYSDEHITLKYLRRYGWGTKRARSWLGRRVHIQTENGVWRIDARGYTFAGSPDAWVLRFEDAVKRVSHCGPEKRARFLLAEI